MIYIIAEIGINHNGNIDLAKKMVRVASFCGCNAVKFQKRDIDSVYTKEFLDSPRESPWGDTQRDQKEGIELSKSEYLELRSICKDIGIDFGASCWDGKSQDFINYIIPDFQKIASPMLTNVEILEKVARSGIHTFISTGMSTVEEIDRAIEIFKRNQCSFELMHCVSVYPMDPSLANLNRIKSLKKMFNCNVGYSGHEVGVSVSIAACTMGITSLERHITLDRSMYGSDQSSSLEVDGLRKLVKYSSEVVHSLGNGSLSLRNEEIEIRKKLRGK